LFQIPNSEALVYVWGAYLIDILFLVIVTFLTALLIGINMDDAMRLANGIRVSENLSMAENMAYLLSITYHVALPATPLRGTVGKLIMKLQIVNENGSRISLLQSLWRFIASIFSTLLLFIGYIIIIFHPEKRSLHDLMANTYVLKK